MNFQDFLLNLFSYFCFYLGGFLIWPSKRNIPALIQIPFFISAILIPLIAIDHSIRFTDQEISTLTLINFLGASSLIFGIVTGKILKIHKYIFFIKFYNSIISLIASNKNKITKLVVYLFTACLVLSFCYLYMGFIPILAEEPMTAKYFKGAYKSRYDDIAVLFRFFQSILFIAIPVSFLFLFQKIKSSNKLILILLCFWAILMFVINLYRGPVLSGLILVASLFAAKSSIKTLFFITFITALYCFGSLIFIFLGINEYPSNFSFLNEVSKGQPDIQDHLIFLSKFITYPTYSYGLTFFGALVPGNYEYNPAVYILNIVNPNSLIENIVSGGFRMTVYLHAFMAFSWIGTAFFSFLYGLLLTRYTLIFKNLNNKSIYNLGLNTLWFMFIAMIFLKFYHLKYQDIITGFFLILILGSEIKISLNGTTKK